MNDFISILIIVELIFIYFICFNFAKCYDFVKNEPKTLLCAPYRGVLLGEASPYMAGTYDSAHIRQVVDNGAGYMKDPAEACLSSREKPLCTKTKKND
jgi:hypothetical protein